jgi:DNA-binding response OmpR family regulator
MSILTGKHVLIIGEETDQITKIEAALITYGADIKTASCESFDIATINPKYTGLILINHMHDGMQCINVLKQIRENEATNVIPILALVPNDQTHIAEVLLLGASDYFLENEDIHSVVDKIKSSLGDFNYDEHSSAIDLSTNDTKVSKGTRVFAVEDDPLLHNLLATRFEKSGLEFEIVFNGEGLIEKLKSFKPEILILDLMLPGESGFDILKKVKSDPETSSIPVIIFSNKDSQDDKKLAAELGASGFHVKAMTDLSELLTIINTHKSQTVK